MVPSVSTTEGINGLFQFFNGSISIFDLNSFLYHWFWFFLGQILYYNRKILDFELSKIKLFICFTLGITTHFSLLILVFEISFRGFYINILSTVSTLIWILFFGGLFNKIFRKESKILNFLLLILLQ